MDTLDVFTSEPSLTQTNILTEGENLIDESSWAIENDPITSIPSDLVTQESPVEELPQDPLPEEQTEDVSSYDIFLNEDSSPLQAVLDKRQAEIAAKDAEENRQIAVLRDQAETDLENWYHDRQRRLEQQFQNVRTAEKDLHRKSLENNSKQICDWSNVMRLIDFTDGKQSSKTKRDRTRMKECILNAKRISDKEKLANGN